MATIRWMGRDGLPYAVTCPHQRDQTCTCDLPSLELPEYRAGETRDEQIARLTQSGDLDPECRPCREWILVYVDRMPTDVFAPRHKASGNCRSGGRHHCTCDICF